MINAKLSRYGSLFALENESSVRLTQLNFLISNHDPDIVHFSCHGSFQELCLEDDNGGSCPLNVDLLEDIFRRLSERVKCVVINACYSAEQAEVISEHIDFVIGMNQAIGDGAAIDYSVGFYGALGAGETIDQAHKCGLIQIKSSEFKNTRKGDYFIPLLYQREKVEDKDENDLEEEIEVESEKILIVLSGVFKKANKARIDAYLKHLGKYCEGMDITLDSIEEGSIKIIIDPEPSDDDSKNKEDKTPLSQIFERLSGLIKSGQGSEIIGMPVREVKIIGEDEMASLSSNAKRNKVPMMFRAQIDGRCQLQRIYPDRTKANEPQDVELWVDEWVDKASDRLPQLPETGNPQPYEINWRFVTNGGQDDGIIRPVIGAYGWPFYPGSSMKGAFRKACTREQADHYCGKELPGKDFQPGILRFHGGYPTSTAWTEGLVDIIHPQQERQVQREKRTSAFAQISLYQPQLKFGISSTQQLEPSEWEAIWQIWEVALAGGLGCRVSAGYGQVADHAGEVLFKCRLKGEGQAPKLIDKSAEFRPNVFRAALRGHALRLFGGLTSADNAESLVNKLFGSVKGKGDVGLLAMSFQPSRVNLGTYGRDRWEQPTYNVEGDLNWMLNRPLNDAAQRQALNNLVRALMHFAMVFGGFGKSWRRADHRLFYKDYAEQVAKPLIGCHWQWGADSLAKNYKVSKLENIPRFLEAVITVAQQWIELQGAENRDWATDWRETWHPNKVQVWGRLAAHEDDSRAIAWLHGPYRESIRSAGISEGSIYKTSVTGQMGKIGRLWHRMYPVVQLKKRKDDPNGRPFAILPANCQYLELLTLFPDNSPEFQQFLAFLDHEQTDFAPLWPQ